MRSRRVRFAPIWLESVYTLWMPTVPARRPSPSVHGRAPTCQPRPPTSSIQSRVCTCERAIVRSVSGGGALCALAVCMRRAALVGVDSCPMEIHCASEMAPSLDARPCSDVPGAAASNEQPVLHVRTREHATAHSHSGGGVPRALAAHAHRAALVGVGSYHIEAHRARETDISLGAWPCFDVPAAASDKQPAFAYAHMRTRHRRLPRERRRTTRACGVRAPRCDGWSRFMPHGNPLRQRDGTFPQCTAVLRRACRGL